MKKCLSIALALAMCLCLSVPAFAAEPDSTAKNTLSSSLSAEVDSETIYLSDGTKITITVLPTSSLPAVYSATAEQTGTVAPGQDVSYQFVCKAANGDTGTARVENTDSNDGKISVTFSYTSNPTTTATKTVKAGASAFITVTSKDGSGLTGTFSTTISASGDDPVTYSYNAWQSST